MIAELIKLSKELYEMEMIDESIDIDNMIHKLYGLSVNNSCASTEEDYEEDSPSRLDGLRHEFDRNSSNIMFKNDLAGIISETLSPDEIEDLIGLLTEHIE
jgi:hypothetical protein